MELKDIKTIKEVSELYNIPVITLKKRINLKSFNMIHDVDYKILGDRQSTLLSPSGVLKLTKRGD